MLKCKVAQCCSASQPSASQAGVRQISASHATPLQSDTQDQDGAGYMAVPTKDNKVAETESL